MLTTIRYILIIIFGLSGAAKLAGLDFEISAFTRWGYPLWFMYMVGGLEFLGAILLLLKKQLFYTSAVLTLLMFGAVKTHLVHAEWAMLVVASAIALLAVFLAFKTMPPAMNPFKKK